MTAQILTVAVRDVSASVTVITAAGEIDHSSQQVLRDAADGAVERGRDCLVLDLSAVTFCDSGGLSLFVDLHRRTTDRGGWLRLAGAQPLVLSVLYATNFDRLLALHPTVDDAVAAAPVTD